MAKKPLRAIAEKGDKKLISDKLKGVNKSEIEPIDLEDLVMSKEGNKATVDFGKKYMKVQKHKDRVGNDKIPYTATNKESPYPGADAKMYEAAECSCDDDKDGCAVHGKKGKKLLLGDKKGVMRENVEFSTLDTTPGLVPAGMQAVAKNLWNGAENHLTGPTVATGQGRPFIAKLGDEIKQLQKEAVENFQEDKQSKAVIKAKGAKKLDDIKGKRKSQALYDKLVRMKNRGVHKEEYVEEEAPPSKSSEEWIKKNKSRFTKEYGKKKGESILYGKAWNDYKEKH